MGKRAAHRSSRSRRPSPGRGGAGGPLGPSPAAGKAPLGVWAAAPPARVGYCWFVYPWPGGPGGRLDPEAAAKQPRHDPEAGLAESVEAGAKLIRGEIAALYTATSQSDDEGRTESLRGMVTAIRGKLRDALPGPGRRHRTRQRATGLKNTLAEVKRMGANTARDPQQ